MDISKRTRVTPTRAGMITEVYFICWNCNAELSEADLATHTHEQTGQ